MSMPPENEFIELRKLIALKRHEQPPPGYFSRFSTEVVSSLRTQRRRGRADASDSDVPAWIVRVFERIQMRPAFAGAFGALVCAGLIGGMFLLETGASNSASLGPLLTEATPVAPLLESAPEVDDSNMRFNPTALEAPPMLASTNVRPSLFDMMPGELDTRDVDYRP